VNATVAADEQDIAAPGTGDGARPTVVLVAPNVSRNMGGEAIKAWQFTEELLTAGYRVHVITHSRVRREFSTAFPHVSVDYIENNALQRYCWWSRIGRPVVAVYFSLIARRRIEAHLARVDGPAVVHYISPVSPVVPIFATPGVAVVSGPINGNIHYPACFRRREPIAYKARRLLHNPLQALCRWFFPGRSSAEVVLVSGGAERTIDSLRRAGCDPAAMHAVIDCGIPDTLFEHPRITHTGENFDFVFWGRLVPHKGVDLAIRALPRCRQPVRLTVVGRGTSRQQLQRLTEELGLSDRVVFQDWFADYGQLHDALRRFRGFVFPSLAEANGIVVQEAMAMGLPVIALDHGGPALLIGKGAGMLIPTASEGQVLDGIAEAMDRLACDGDLAESISATARGLAVHNGFGWTRAAGQWTATYPLALKRHRDRHAAPPG
jgi:glycosyltransferase involved in cell wall biosynthesis